MTVRTRYFTLTRHIGTAKTTTVKVYLAQLTKCRKDAEQEEQEPAYLNAQVRMYQRSNEHYFLRARRQFDNENEFHSLVLALQRTGFIAPASGQPIGIYELSPFFDKITQLIDFQEALKKEPERTS